MSDWEERQGQFLRYRAGDSAVVSDLFGDLQRILRGFFYARTRSAALADDLAQASLLKIHLARDRFRAELSLKTWVFTIARRCLIDHWRGAADEIHAPETEAQAPDDPWSPQPLENREDLLRALDELKPTDRSIVYLHTVEGLSMAEIAASLGLTEGAVKVRAHRSYRKLRELLGGWVIAVVLREGIRLWR